MNGGIRIAYVAGQSLPASMGASQLLLSGVSKNRVLQRKKPQAILHSSILWNRTNPNKEVKENTFLRPHILRECSKLPRR